MKKFIYFILGFFIFYNIYTFMEYIVVSFLGMKQILSELFRECFIQCIIFYALAMLIIFIINYIYNIFIVKILNNKIKLLKKERRNNDDEE
jgi:hypothetical protein